MGFFESLGNAIFGTNYVGTKGTDLPKAPPPPILSCFVQGIVKSMRDTPGEWREKMAKRKVRRYGDQQMVHRDGLVVAWEYRRYQEIYSPVWIDEVLLSEDEQHSLYAAIMGWHSLKEEKAKAKRQAKLAPTKARFEALGCPPSHDHP